MRTDRSCLIVGAGLAGLTAAHFLKARGFDVMLLDKGWRAGGRMATRLEEGATFDYGAQFFTVRESLFADTVSRWLSRGWVQNWFSEGGHTRYRGTDGMKGLALCMADSLECLSSTRVSRIEPAESGWRILADGGIEVYARAVILTAPAPQALELIADCAHLLPDSLVQALGSITFDPCFAVLASLSGPSRVPPPGFVRPEGGPVAFIGDNTQKGISPLITALTIHASAEFSRSSLNFPRAEVEATLLEAARPWLGSPVRSVNSHFWKFSQPVSFCPAPCLFTVQPAPLAIAGDAFAAPRIEGTFLSGWAAASRIADELSPGSQKS